MIVALAVLASQFGLDVILGAFAAGIIVGIVTRGTDAHEFAGKLDAVGFGFLIPVFFIATGMDYDLDALFSDAASIALVPGFALLFLVIRGIPALVLYRRHLPSGERLALAAFSGAALPLLVAITQIGLDTHTMRPEVAVSLVGAGMLSVLIFPLVGLSLHRRAERTEPLGASKRPNEPSREPLRGSRGARGVRVSRRSWRLARAPAPRERRVVSRRPYRWSRCHSALSGAAGRAPYASRRAPRNIGHGRSRCRRMAVRRAQGVRVSRRSRRPCASSGPHADVEWHLNARVGGQGVTRRLRGRRGRAPVRLSSRSAHDQARSLAPSPTLSP